MKKIKNLIKFFYNETKKKLFLLLFIILFTSLIQLFSLSSMIPAFAILSNENLIFDNQIFNLLYTSGNFGSTSSFKIFIILCSCFLILITVLFNFITTYLQNKFSNSVYSKLEIIFFNNYLGSSYNSFKKKKNK